MDISVVEGAGYIAVRVRGLLSLRTAPELRDVLLKVAAEQPRGLVCDLSEAAATREGLTVLHVVADQVADWPSSPIALVASAPPLLQQLERLGLRRRLPVVADLSDAPAALRDSPRLLLATTQLPATVDAPAASRAFVAGALTRWGAPGIVEGARWVVSELVTNAVVHARTDVTVRVSLAGRRVSLSVSDRGNGGSVRRDVAGAWGLHVVEQLARGWGVLPRLGGGTVVWALLNVDAPVSTVLPHQLTRDG
jgi:anti-sigma regulatory factor (Ser/Thr protein kinase)/anti-anti-sigma regulatory factor